ncbi:ABC transporter substrate-binding protein, partial [Azospirillum brasilense]|nr:ABC transporter substrate-binding protein [Azospirillum brasilense]
QSGGGGDRSGPGMRAEGEATWAALRDQFRAGIPNRWTEEEREAAAKLYGLMAKLGGRELVGNTMALPDGTFWPEVHF